MSLQQCPQYNNVTQQCLGERRHGVSRLTAAVQTVSDLFSNASERITYLQEGAGPSGLPDYRVPDYQGLNVHQFQSSVWCIIFGFTLLWLGV